MTDEQLPPTANTSEQSLARERLYLTKIKELELGLGELQSKVAELANAQKTLSSAMQSQNARLDRLRLDKQLAGFPTWVKKKVRGPVTKVQRPRRPSPNQLLVVAPKYPTVPGQYGGQPIARRMRFLRAAGFRISILVDAPSPEPPVERDGVTVIRAPYGTLPQVISTVAPAQILIHHPVPESWKEVKPLVGEVPIHVWIHGFEARSWRESLVNYSDREIEELGSRLDAVDVERQMALREMFPEERVTKVFISNYVRAVAEGFVGVEATNSHVIHNVVDSELFRYVPRRAEDRLRVLSIKSYANRTYATDLILPIIEKLSHDADFNMFQFGIRGDGRFFEDDTRELERFENVSVIRGVLDATEMADLTSQFGVMLLPTRLDTQGMTMGESMARGMVVVSNRVAAIPEFADESCAILVDRDDAAGMAAALAELASDPERFLELSASAASRVNQQCGISATVEREIELLRQAARRVD